jgi:hypothetical protein
MLNLNQLNSLLSSLNIIQEDEKGFQKIEFGNYKDQDGHDHIIIKDTNREMLNAMYNNFYGTGAMCGNRSSKFYKRISSLGFEKQGEVDIITIASLIAKYHFQNGNSISAMAHIMSYTIGWLESDLISVKFSRNEIYGF